MSPSLWAELIPLGVIVACSPIPVIEMILVLFSRRPIRNGIAFLVTAAVVACAVSAAVSALVDSAADDAGAGASPLKAWIQIALGAVLLILAARSWHHRHHAGTPAIFDRIAGMGTGAIVLLALTATAANPKNLLLYVSAGAVLAAHHLDLAQTLTAAAVYAIIATLPMLAAVVYLAVGGASARAVLDAFKHWLMRNTPIVMACVLAVLGVIVVAGGLGGL